VGGSTWRRACRARPGGALKIVDPTDKSVRTTPLARIHPAAAAPRLTGAACPACPKELYRPVCSYFRARKNACWKPVASWLQRFSAVAQTRQLSHTACSLSFAYFNARIFTTIKTRVRRGHLKWHFPVASARCQAVALPNFCAAGTFFCTTARSRHQFDALSASKSLGPQD
jgi:hypothetical protein